MGNNCCKSFLSEVENIHEVSTGEWDFQNCKQSFSKKKQIIIFNKSSLKYKCKIDIDMKVTSSLKSVETKKYFKNQTPPSQNETAEFTDEIFGPNDNSIKYINPQNDWCKDVTPEELEDISGLKWHRPNEFYKGKEYSIYKDINPEDIKQGALGNCYFLSSIAAIAEFPERVKDNFINKSIPNNNCYEVKLFVQGKPKIVVVDDYLPCYKNGRLCFTHTSGSDNELWVGLLEKAWAKVNGSYATTIAGLPSEGLSALTEAPCITYIHRKYDSEIMWNIIFEADKKDYIICTCTQARPDLEKLGLVEGHAYTVKSAYEVRKDNGETLKLLQVRNPWGQFEWKGDWSDDSDLWTEDVKKQVHYVNSDDGSFYMDFNDFLEFFPYSFICKYESSYKYNYKKYYQNPHETMVVCKINIEKPTDIIINLHQKSQRMYNKIDHYALNMSRIIICKYDKTKSRPYTFIKSHASLNEKLYLELKKLDQGEYHIFSHVNWPYLDRAKNSYVISTYANEDVPIIDCKREEIREDFMHLIFYSYMEEKVQRKDIKKDLEFYSSISDNDLGFYAMLFKNTSQSEKMMVTFDTDSNNNVRLCTEHPHSKHCGNSQVHNGAHHQMVCNIEPNTDYLVLWEILNEPWHSKLKISSLKISTKEDTLPDPSRLLIKRHLKKLNKTPLEMKDVLCGEFEHSEGLFLVFENTSERTVKMRVDLTELVNLSISKTEHRFVIESKNFFYLPLKKIDNTSSIDFKYSYNLKKQLI